MRPIDQFPLSDATGIRFVLTDIDDTVTRDGRLAARTYQALELLHEAGVKVIPVTAAPAGWCDQMARFWPIPAIVGENGGFYFAFDHQLKRVRRRFWIREDDLDLNRERLAELAARVVDRFPEAELCREHAYREITLAIGFESEAARARLSAEVVDDLRRSGANSTMNSLWVLAWLGEFDKLAMGRIMMAEVFAVDIDSDQAAVLYLGDSVNDAPMFGFFEHSVGVSTVTGVTKLLPAPPKWITTGAGGDGFVEVADLLLSARRGAAP
jgi:HAD superfamily hydrolase (TIGR01484 family)